MPVPARSHQGKARVYAAALAEGTVHRDDKIIVIN
jgi:hypothetical protein